MTIIYIKLQYMHCTNGSERPWERASGWKLMAHFTEQVEANSLTYSYIDGSSFWDYLLKNSLV